jgi:hypothetical protein
VSLPSPKPKAWRGSEFQNPAEWCVNLDKAALAELDAALLGVAGETPNLTLVANAIREELSHGRGFVVIRGLPLGRYTEDEAKAAYAALCSKIGKVIPQTLRGDLLYSVRDEGLTLDRDYGKAGVRTSKTRGAFQFHTDSPSRVAGYTPDFVGLLILRTAMSGGESALVNGYEIINTLQAERPDVLARLYQPFWVDRRAELPPGEEPVLPTPVLTRRDAALVVRYLRFYITKGHEWKGEPLSATETEALDVFDEIMARPGVALEIAPQEADIQLINNTFLLHSRTEYQDFPEPERRRHYIRIWLADSAEDQRADRAA